MVKNKTFDSLNRDFVELTLSEIIPYPKNNRKHSKKDIDEIIKSIQKDGYIAPIIVDEANVVIA
jgi:ParB-like chromosome segregation protein Spo0J